MKKFYPISLASLFILSGVFGLWTWSRAGSEEIAACVNSAGIMRYLASGECRRGETELSWSIRAGNGQQWHKQWGQGQ